MKRFLTLILCFASVMWLCACGASGESASTDEKANDSVDVSQLSFTPMSLISIGNDVEENKLRARDEYEGKYVSVSGEVSTINENYFSIIESNYPYSIQSAGFKINSDSLREELKKLSKGDVVTVKGKIIEIDTFNGHADITFEAYEITRK